MESINLQDLGDYREDAQGLRNFQRLYLVPSLAGVVVALAGLILIIAEMQAGHYHGEQAPGMLDVLWFQYGKIARETGVSLAMQSYLPAALFAAGLVIFFITMARMAMAAPPSSVPNVKMEKYWNANPERPGDREIIYVDRAARTYFRRVFVTRSGPRTPAAPWAP